MRVSSTNCRGVRAERTVGWQLIELKSQICGLWMRSGSKYATVCSSGSVLERLRGVDEINAMRCSLATCEIAVAKMREQLQPGIAETELWAVLHAENIARGGEWIETRILTSGPRTNPWMQEAGPRRIESGDLLAFDTDMVGPTACVPISLGLGSVETARQVTSSVGCTQWPTSTS
ncbi:hypothetical protein MPL1032_180055 [Mesorhizobium plurifarium]|uniref:Peptidase M24 domain-containing protein n=1 Tax=Mesorhizobium plurifarium TaxID=69974 RepID=A0A0K2VU57_MESPL|nr:hypothetical protein MPL1032_180055 [Mesorhizobium plurifarium]